MFLERALNNMLDLEVYRACVGTWAARTGWSAQGSSSKVQVRSYLLNTCMCAAVLTVLLVIGGVEQNPRSGVDGESLMQVMCSGCDKCLKSRTVRHVWTLVSQQLRKR